MRENPLPKTKVLLSSRRAGSIANFAFLLLGLLTPAAEGKAPALVPIVFHVAESRELHVAIEPFIASQVRHANQALAPTGIAFVDDGRQALAREHAVLVTREDRDALLTQVTPGAVHCMVVAKLMDVDEPGRERRGVHWYRAGTSRPHMVILSTLAGDYVLAHELGHFFGNPAHSQQPGNLMSYLPGVLPPFLTEPQQQRVKRSLAAMRRNAELPARWRNGTP
jgi:hypothetical protein